MKKLFLFTLLPALLFPVMVSGQTAGDAKLVKAAGVVLCTKTKAQYDGYSAEQRAALQVTAYPMDDIEISTGTFSRGSNPTVTGDRLLFTIISSTDKTVKIGAAEDSYSYTGYTKSQYYSNLFVSGEVARNNAFRSDIYVPSRINIDGEVYTVTEISEDWIANNQIGEYANRKEIYIPQTVKKIGKRACCGIYGQYFNLKFYQTNADGSPAHNGSSLIVGDAYNGIEEIGEEGFLSCRFSSLPVGASTHTLGKGAFASCSELTLASVQSALAASNVTTLPEDVFYNCLGMSGELTIPANITSLGVHAFRKCTNITNFDLSQCTGLHELPDGVFAGCTGLSPSDGELVIPSHIKTVGAIWWFDTNGTNIGNFTPAGVTSISFGDVRNLSLGAYNTKGITAFTVPSTVTSLRPFSETTGLYLSNDILQHVTFPAGLSISIPDSCFRLCYALSTIDFGNVTGIGKRAFESCRLLTSVSIPSSVTSMGSNTFAWCTSLTSAFIPADIDLEYLPDYMFSQCSQLSSVTFPSKLKTIGKGCFNYCNLSTLLDLPSGVSEIDDEAFANNHLSSFEMTAAMKSNLLRIGEYAFSGNAIPYMKWDVATAYNPSFVLEGHAFDNQETSLTVEFTPECTTVPAYLNNTNHQSPFGIARWNDIGELRALRVIVPISSVTAYTAHPTMQTVPYTDYRVKFKWGSFTDEESLKTDLAKDFDKRSYYNLYNITPQQRLVATSAWENDYLNFRPTMMVDGEALTEVKGKGFSFEEAPALSFGPKKTLGDFDGTWYSNTVDYWQDNVAVPYQTERTFFEEPYTEGGEELGFAFNASDFDKTDEASYPVSLMPYSIHTYHANITSENPVGEPRIGRRPVMDGIVPPNKGIVIDFPKPGYYLVPPAFHFNHLSEGLIAEYPVKQDVSGLYDGADKSYHLMPNISANFWYDLNDYSFENMGEPQMDWAYKRIPYETVEALDARLTQFITDNNLEGVADWSTLSAEQKVELSAIIADYNTMIANASSIDDVNDYWVDDWFDSPLFGEKDIFTDDQGGTWFIPEITSFYFYRDDDHSVVEGMFWDILMFKLRVGLLSIDDSNGIVITDENGVVWHMRTVQSRGIAKYTFAQSYPLSEMVHHLNDPETVKEYEFDEDYVYQDLVDTDYYDGMWYNIFDIEPDFAAMSINFNTNHDSETDHNVIIPCVGPTMIYPYWAASPYAYETEGQPADRFNGDGTFNYETYGRMGHGDTYIYIWDEDKSKTALLDNDIQYVNFGFKGGYFVHANAANQTQPNRAYFSIHKDHMKALFPQSPQNGKFFFHLEDNTGSTTGITTLDNGRLTTEDDMWFTLSGVRLSGKPSEKGIYIHNGKKIIIR